MNAHSAELAAQSREADPLDRTGHDVIGLLKKAALIAEQNTQSALTTAHRLSMQLREAEDRIAELEASNRAYKQRVDQAEGWLRRIYQEVEQMIGGTTDDQTRAAPRPAGAEAYAPRAQRR